MKVKIKDITITCTAIYRKVKYIRFELTYDHLNLIIPEKTTQSIEDIIKIKENYLYKKIKQYRQLESNTTNLELNTLSDVNLRKLVDKFIKIYEKKLNVSVNRLQYRQTKYKWGSCSIRGNITLSYDLKYLPEKLIKYIVYHELTHLIVLKHNTEFFNIIKKEFPDYISLDEELKLYEFNIFKTKKRGEY